MPAFVTRRHAEDDGPLYLLIQEIAMVRKTLYGALAVSLLLGSAATADAQFLPIRFNIHGGAALPVGDFGSSDLTNANAGLADLGFRLGVGLEFRPPLFPVGLRLDGAWDRMEQEGDGPAYSIFSATANAVVALPVTPLYLIGGIGYYRTDLTGDGVDVEASNDFGFNLGAGFSLPVPGFSPFIEARWNRITVDEATFDFDTISYIPIVVGFRF